MSRRPWRTSLGSRLLVGHLLVVVARAVTLAV